MTPDHSSQVSLAVRPLVYTTGWVWVLCVIGLDYISSLAYVPSVAFSVAGTLSPLVMGVVVLATVGLAVPLFCYTAGRSPNGHGSIGLLERVIPGWRGKFLIVVLLGFIATDLVFTRTFSAADAAEHLIHSPVLPWQKTLDDLAQATERAQNELPNDLAALVAKNNLRQFVVTVGLLIVGSVFGWVFRKGVDRRLVMIAVSAMGIYLLLTVTIIGFGVWYLIQHPDLVDHWWAGVRAGSWKTTVPSHGLSLSAIVFAAVVMFPHVALGLSGYELTLAAMPLIRGYASDDPEKPKSRIRRARWMLIVSALLMSVILLASSLIVAILIPAEALTTDGQAANRSLAYLAHGGKLNSNIDPQTVCPLFGTPLGAVYDFSTVVVLTLAGVTVLIGTREFIPPYLHRLGMDWTWSKRLGLLMYLFTIVKIGVTYVYRADVDAQRGAYLTGVLALFTGASLTAVADVWQRRARAGWKPYFRISIIFTISSIVFAASLVSVAIKQPAAIRMAGIFVIVLLGTSMITRFFRTRELRFEGFDFADTETFKMWDDLTNNHFPMLVPIRPGGEPLSDKERDIRSVHRLPSELQIVFIQAEIGDPSEFSQRPLITIKREQGRILVRITRCSSLAHAIAAAALDIAKEGPVPEVHFGWSADNPLTANINFVLFGQGNIPWMVHELIRVAKVPPERKPRVLVG